MKEVRGIVRCGGGSGTGLFIFSEQVGFNEGDNLMANFIEPKIDDPFFPRIIFSDGRKGIYVPRDIIQKNNLKNKRISIELKKIDGFHSKFGKNGRFYIPDSFVTDLKLKKNDVLLVQIFSGNKKKEYLRVRSRAKKNRIEYFCFSNHKFKGDEIVKIKKLKKKISFRNAKLKDTLNNFEFAEINSKQLIIFEKQKKAAIIKKDLWTNNKLEYYLGAFFADGTKVGNSWAICASTPEQADFYFKMHNQIIFNPLLDFTISFTKNRDIRSKNLSGKIINYWKNNCFFNLTNCRIRINNSNSSNANNINRYGTLIIKENKQILLILYNRLLKQVFSEIEKGNKKIALNFILGVLEGDGTANAKKRGHILIATNKEDSKKLSWILKKANVLHKVCKEKGDKYYIRIGALEILRNFLKIKDKVFEYYPKRRKAFIERMFSIGATKFITGQQDYATAWVKADLKKSGILNKKFELTKKGKEVKQALLDLKNEMKSVTVK